MVQFHEQINTNFFYVFCLLSSRYLVHLCAASTVPCPTLSFSVTFMLGPSLVNYLTQYLAVVY